MDDTLLAGRPRTGLWLAREEPEGRVVAVRRARPGVAPHAEVKRELAREARVLARIGPHEAVLGLLVDASSGDPPRLVLEGGDLVPLAKVLEGGEPLGAAAALALVVPLADALGEAHARGVVHGAVGPATVLVTTRGWPKLVLWADAIADGVDPPDARDASLVDPTWLAPEVLMGEVPSAAADVFALGCLLVTAATGIHPFAEAEGSGERRALSAGPQVVRSAIARGMSEPVARVAARALAKHPADRHDSAAELAASLVEASSVPDRNALAAALARRGLASMPSRARALPGPRAERAPSPLPFVAILGGLLVWAGAVELVAGDPVAPPGAPAIAASGQLRILAQPWAHVALDGEPLDTTPIGAPVPVSPGRHVVDFVHPQAPKAQRVVEVRPGQTVVVDVILDVPPASLDAGVDASP